MRVMISLRGKDLRAAARRKYEATGWIRLGGGFAIRKCKVINVSDGGARIAVASQQAVPNSFSFTLDRRRAGCAARVKWRKGTEMGLEFVPEPADRS